MVLKARIGLPMQIAALSEIGSHQPPLFNNWWAAWKLLRKSRKG